MVDLLFLRGLERLIAVVVGGMAIYLGFRLFLAVPGAGSEGEAELAFAKDKRLVFTRIGPGVFFALFGAAIVLGSYYFGVSVTEENGRYAGFGQVAVEATPPPPAPVTADRALAADALAFLTERQRAAEGDEDAAWRIRSYREAKLAILLPFWPDAWGDPREFRFWLRDPPADRPNRPAFERALSALDRGELP